MLQGRTERKSIKMDYSVTRWTMSASKTGVIEVIRTTQRLQRRDGRLTSPLLDSKLVEDAGGEIES